MSLWLLQVPVGQPLYRPLLILSIFLVLIMGAAVWVLWRHPPAHEELSTLEKFRELVRAILTAALTAGFVILTFEGKIDAAIYANSFGMILAFLFGTKVGEPRRP
jgi:uncharacterized protein YhhL (DUF1145 family)